MKMQTIDLTNGGKFYDAVIKTCMHCKCNTFFKITKEQYEGWVENGEYIHRLFPNLNAEMREMIITGTHPECWNKMFGE